MEKPTNDWERTYQAAIACPGCGSPEVCAKGCPVLRKRARRLAYVVIPLVVADIARGIWFGDVVGIVAGFIPLAIGAEFGWILVRRSRRVA